MKRPVAVDEGAIHLLVEIEIKGVEGALRVAEAREFVPALQQTVLSPAEFVGDEGGDEIDRPSSQSALAAVACRGLRPSRRAAVAGGRDRVR
jgi:hypothetical protein